MLAAVLATATGLLPTPLHRYAAGARSSAPMASSSDYDVRLDEVAERSSRLIAAKEEAGLSFDELATKLGLTNTYTAQLFLGQAQLKANTAPKLKKALPSVSDDDVQAMMAHFPMRGFDERILQEPNVYRTYEAVTHYGEAIKRIINEECGDGIMSAIDFYCAHPRLHCSRPQPSPALPRLRHQPLVGAPAVTPAIPRPRRRCRDDNRQGGREARRHHIQRQVPALHRAAGRRQHGFESEGLRARGRAMCLSNRALEADRLWSSDPGDPCPTVRARDAPPYRVYTPAARTKRFTPQTPRELCPCRAVYLLSNVPQRKVRMRSILSRVTCVFTK